MRIPGSAKWLVFALLFAGCARDAPPAPVFDRMLALLQTNQKPTSTVQLRSRIDGVSRVPLQSVAPDDVAVVDVDRSARERAAPRPKVDVQQIARFEDDRSTGEDDQSAGVQTGQPIGTQLAALPNPAGRTGASFHTVARGDTLYNISKRYGSDVATLADLNRIRAPYTISLGQRIELPPNQRSISPVDVPAEVIVASADPSVLSDAQPIAVHRPAPRVTQPPFQLASIAAPRLKPSAPSRLISQPVAHIGAPPPRAGGKFAWPVDGRILVGYGPTGDGLHNDGLNIAAPLETPVRASENGVVAYAGNEIRGFGKLVLIKHDGGLISAYGHNQDLLVRRGDVVRKGQVIARVGASGGVEVPQLHFEIREGRRAVDPRKLLPAGKA